jgi:predicted anti-sigma-YlaC factor YlaD
MMSMPEHLDAEAIYALLEGELEPGRERAAEAHLWRCDACRALREECAGTLGGLRWYGRHAAAPPEGYWERFWARWPLAGDLDARRRPAGATRQWVAARRVATAAAVAILVAGTWWAAERRGLEAERLASRAAARLDPAATTAAHELVAGTAWENDVELIRRVTFTIGSVDPLSKGVVLASMAEEP